MGKRRAAWAVWLLAAALLWLFENSAATLTALLASILLPAASMLAARRAARSLAAELSAPDEAAKGGAIPFALTLRAAGFLFRIAGRVVCENRLTGERAETPFSAAPGRAGTAALTLTADAARCGTLRLRAEAWTEDLFGLTRGAPAACTEEFVTVAPELFPTRVTLSENTAAAAESERYSPTRPGSDPSETFAIREYRPGDPIRQIHWKLSQKTGETMLRELGLPVVSRTLLVFCNLAAGEPVPPETADAMAEVFLSVSRALLADGYAHTVAYAEDGRFTLRGTESETDLRALQASVLALAWEPDDGALARLLAEVSCAHILLVGASAPQDAARLCPGSRVTLLAPSGAAAPEGVYAVPFTAERYREELQMIEG